MLETSTAVQRGRLPSLTGMRFLAALLVFVAHVAQADVFDDPRLSRGLAENATQAGWVGVSFFFVLSGFVLTWTARPEDRPGLFIRRRLAKIYPNHLVTWVAGVVLVVVTGTSGFATALPSLGLVQAWVPVPSIAFVPNDPSWSLCAELVFYLAFPWLLPWVRRIPDRHLLVAAAALVGVLVLIPFLAGALPDAPEMTYFDGPSCAIAPCAGFSWWAYWSVFLLPISRLPEFVLGMLTARLIMSRRAPVVGMPVALVGVAVGYVVMLVLPGAHGMVWPTVVPLALVVAAGARGDIGGTPSLWRSSAMVRLGEWSFAFYLVHLLVITYGPLSSGAHRTPGALALIAGSLAVSIVLGWLLHTGVEKPAVRRWSRPPAARGASPASPVVVGAESKRRGR